MKSYTFTLCISIRARQVAGELAVHQPGPIERPPTVVSYFLRRLRRFRQFPYFRSKVAAKLVH